MGVYCAQTWKQLMFDQTPSPLSAWSPLATDFCDSPHQHLWNTYFHLLLCINKISHDFVQAQLGNSQQQHGVSNGQWPYMDTPIDLACHILLLQVKFRENCILKDFVTICWESCNCHSPAFHPRRFPPERKTVKVKVVDSTFLFYDWEISSKDDSGLFLDIS